MAEGRRLSEDAAESERCKKREVLRARKASQELRDSRRAQVAVREGGGEREREMMQELQNRVRRASTYVYYICKRGGHRESKRRRRGRDHTRGGLMESCLESIIRRNKNGYLLVVAQNPLLLLCGNT